MSPKYEKPLIIPFNSLKDETGLGLCKPLGSTDAGQCRTGSTATPGACKNGSTAGGCNSGSSP